MLRCSSSDIFVERRTGSSFFSSVSPPVVVWADFCHMAYIWWKKKSWSCWWDGGILGVPNGGPGAGAWVFGVGSGGVTIGGGTIGGIVSGNPGGPKLKGGGGMIGGCVSLGNTVGRRFSH